MMASGTTTTLSNLGARNRELDPRLDLAKVALRIGMRHDQVWVERTAHHGVSRQWNYSLRTIDWDATNRILL
jgi:hypothetical protein